MCFSFYQSLLCNTIHHRVGVLYPEGIRVRKARSTRCLGTRPLTGPVSQHGNTRNDAVLLNTLVSFNQQNKSVEVWEVQNITDYKIFRKPNSKVQVSFSDRLWSVVCVAVRPQSINFLELKYVISYLIFRTNGK